jgi:POT family proton-dependent oligopeptide transporter
MNAILYIYCVHLYISSAIPENTAADIATSTVHLFKTGVYAFPMIGAIIADRYLGKFRSILYLSWVYCLGHLVLSLSEGSIFGLYSGLALIAIGSGGIKPCVSANVGDQFGRSNWHLLERVYQIFYFTINIGSFFAVALIPLFKEWFGWSVAFLIPGILMGIATVIFWLGRNEFVHIPAKPAGNLGFLDAMSSTLLFFTAGQPFWIILLVSSLCFAMGLTLFSYRQSIERDDGFFAILSFMLREGLLDLVLRRKAVYVSTGTNRGGMNETPTLTRSAENEFGQEAVDGVRAVFSIMSVFILVSIFWALFEQHASSWIRQAGMMDRVVSLPALGSINLLPSQIPALNPIMVMLLIPLWAYLLEPLIENLGFKFTPLRKMSLGMLLASSSFVVVALIQAKIDSDPNTQVHIFWQLIPYFLITLSEVLVSVTGLEFAYSQAPRRMKSTVMGFWMLTIAFGNVLVALLARFGHLPLVDFFWVFAVLMTIAAIIFMARASFYQVRDYPQ